MSDAPPPSPPTAAPADSPAPSESLKSPQFIVAMIAMLIAAGVIGRVLWSGDAQNINLIIGIAVGGMMMSVVNFYVGSSQSSQKKDEQKPTP